MIEDWHITDFPPVGREVLIYSATLAVIAVWTGTEWVWNDTPSTVSAWPSPVHAWHEIPRPPEYLQSVMHRAAVAAAKELS